MFDIAIIGGTVLDGSGAPAQHADVGLNGDRVTAVGPLARAEAAVRIDATGCVVCPGFIDTHSHSDTCLLLDPSAPSKLHQGVTTEIVGNCGASAAPVTGAYRLPSDWRDRPYPGTWRTVAEYRRLLESVRPAPNVCLLIGHNNLRGGVLGYGNRHATADELRTMARLLEQALDEGGRGLSTGLIYPPGLFAPSEELAVLAAVAARRGGLYASHMRSEGRRLLPAIDEALAVGRESGARVQISHLKTKGRETWPLVDEALARIQAARDAGVPVAADRYPYTASCTSLDVVFPDWAEEGGNDVILARVRNPQTRERLRRELEARYSAAEWSEIVVATTYHPDTLPFQGLSLPEVAGRLGLSPAEAVLRIVDLDDLRTEAFFVSMDEGNMLRIYAQPWVMVGSDASARALSGPLAGGFPHPRAFGTFPRFLRMALDGETMPLPEAVRRMTALPAAHFGLDRRGRLAPDHAADVVVFNPRTVRDPATLHSPLHLAEGIRTVIVNGVLTLDDGRLTGQRAGRML